MGTPNPIHIYGRYVNPYLYSSSVLAISENSHQYVTGQGFVRLSLSGMPLTTTHVYHCVRTRGKYDRWRCIYTSSDIFVFL